MATQPIANMTATWSNGSTDYTAIKMNATDAASAAASKLLDLQVGGVSKFKVDKAGNVTLASNDAGAGVAPVLTLLRDSASPAASDLVGKVLWQGRDSAANLQDYAEVDLTITDATSGSEDASLRFRVATAGTMTTGLTLTGTRATFAGDVFLPSGAVMNWNAGDVTLAHSANALAFAGATNGYSFDTAIKPSGGITFYAAATISGVDYGATKGITFTSDLNKFVGTVSMENQLETKLGIQLSAGTSLVWGLSDVSITHSTNALAFTGASNGYSFDGSLTFADNADTTKKAKLDSSTLTAGNTRTYKLPDLDGMLAELPNHTDVNGNANTTLNFRPYPRQVFATGTLTADRTWTLSAATGVAGSPIRISRTAAGAFDLIIGSLTTLKMNEFCDIAYDGTNFVLLAQGQITNLRATATLDFPSTAAGASSDLTIPVTGAAIGDKVALALPASPTAGIVFNAFVSAADTVTVRAFNITGSAVNPAAASYGVIVLK